MTLGLGPTDWEHRLEARGHCLLIARLPNVVRQGARRHPVLTAVALNGLMALSVLAMAAAVSLPHEQPGPSLRADLRHR